MPRRPLFRRPSIEELERREVLSVGFVDSGQSLPSSTDIALGDLDGDGDLDAFFVERDMSTVWLNDGDGIFLDSGQRLGKSSDPTLSQRAVALGDVDGDGDPDALVGGSEPMVWWNNGEGQFTDSGQRFSKLAWSVALADSDGDGDLDALILRYGFSSRVELWLNNGKSDFADSGQELGFSRWEFASGDLDRDGDLDLLVQVAGGLQVRLNDGDGNFVETGRKLVGAKAALGDVDGDGDVDAVSICDCSQQHKDRVWLNDGGGNFVDSRQELGDGLDSGLELGDLDGDSDLDALVFNRGGTPLTLRLNDGEGVFREAVVAVVSDVTVEVIHASLGDLDGDNDLDAFVGTPSGSKVLINLSDVAPAVGDANEDFSFNTFDIVQVLVAGRYLTGKPAVWGEGDWNTDGVFDQLDIVAALQTGNYLQGPYVT